jgi:hypothetical protein
MLMVLGVSPVLGQAPASAAPLAAPTDAAQPSKERPGAGRSFDLHPKWVVGDVQRYSYELMNYHGAQAADDDKKRQGELFRQEGRLLRKVVSSDDKGTVLAFTFERFYLQEARGTKVQYFDSDFGDDPNRVTYLTPRVKKWMSRTITVKLNSDSQVVGIEGLDPAQAVGPMADAQDTREPVDIDETIVKKMWRPMYRLDKPQLAGKIGETWTMHDSSEDPETGKFDLAIHHELKDVTGGLVTIESHADVKFTPTEGPDSMHAKLEAMKITGTYEWDLKNGRLRTWNTEQESTMDAERGGAHLKLKSKTVTGFKWMDPDAPKDDPQAGGKPMNAGADPSRPQTTGGGTGKP